MPFSDTLLQRFIRAESKRALPCLLWIIAVVVLLSAATRSVNHDESQYVAAIALMPKGLPYRDFAYLQTPLQPLLLSPLAFLPAGWMLVGVRFANAFFGMATILLLLRTLRNRVAPWAALTSIAALACTGAFLLACSLARNDALAMALLALALPALLAALERHDARLFALAGAALGLATAAKISAALPAAGIAIFLLCETRVLGARALAGLVTGFLVGLLPCTVLASIAPAQFRFDVLAYNLEAPAQWWTMIGQGAELDPLRRVIKLIGFACLGSVLVALLAICFDRNRTESRRLLDWMIAGGLVAAFLPKPALVQYMVPLLPPLFARFAFALDAARPRSRRALVVLAAIGSIAGLTSSIFVRFAGFELIRMTTTGREVAGLARGGEVATLSPQFVAGAGVALDKRFAAGPFLYRTRGGLARKAEVEGRSATKEFLAQTFASEKPSLILVGGEHERFDRVFPNGLDEPLIAWARGHAYRPIRLKSGLVAFVGQH